MAEDKVAGASYLAAYGLPVAPIRAIYAPCMRVGRLDLLSSRRALRDFLSNPAHYPLFGKPVAGFQSLGSIGLYAFDNDTQLIASSASTIPIDVFVDEVVARFERGYLFQQLLTAHRELHPAIGAGLSTDSHGQNGRRAKGIRGRVEDDRRLEHCRQLLASGQHSGGDRSAKRAGTKGRHGKRLRPEDRRSPPNDQ